MPRDACLAVYRSADGAQHAMRSSVDTWSAQEGSGLAEGMSTPSAWSIRRCDAHMNKPKFSVLTMKLLRSGVQLADHSVDFCAEVLGWMSERPKNKATKAWKPFWQRAQPLAAFPVQRQAQACSSEEAERHSIWMRQTIERMSLCCHRDRCHPVAICRAGRTRATLPGNLSRLASSMWYGYGLLPI